VNRIFNEDGAPPKPFGYIVDYRGVLRNLGEALIPDLIDRNLSHSEGRGGTKRRGGRLACDGFRSPGRGITP
jgi:hypothetical protein